MERLSSAIERIEQIIEEQKEDFSYRDYFLSNARFILVAEETRKILQADKNFDRLQIEEHIKLQDRLYEDVKPENYATSLCNFSYMSTVYGEDMGRILALLAYEIRSIIPMIYRNAEDEYITVLELFLEVYTAFRYEEEVGAAEIENIIYYYAFDYLDVSVPRRLAKTLLSADNFIKDIILNSDLSDMRYLYKFGDYISDTEKKVSLYLSTLPKERVQKMANVLIEGYAEGFRAAGKNLDNKKYVGLLYTIGFERLVKEVISGFKKRGLETVIFEKPYRLADKSSSRNRGSGSIGINKQCEYDHRFDNAILMKKSYTDRKADMVKLFFEENKEEVALYAGPALIEVFGEKDFEPKNDPHAYHYDKKQKKRNLETLNALSIIQNKYIKGEETSFSIIAWPLPEIADTEDGYAKIFDDIIRINTLDSKIYSDIQQHIIDALDKGRKVRILGGENNRTDLTVMLHPLKNPDRESLFENCVADVNIPVGEVFTSPILEGTEGVLHVSEVYIGDIQFRDLILHFKDGMVSDYACGNFEKEEENRKLIEDILLKNHAGLPMGEFAIGTNTAAYAVGKKYGIQRKFPILIAEKTGPHFAIGDTCYSHEEDYMTYNPDGKAIIARDNEVSRLRKTDISKAYYNCHTDITIPYDELGEIFAVDADDNKIYIIKDGKFVLHGTELLNKEMGE